MTIEKIKQHLKDEIYDCEWNMKNNPDAKKMPRWYATLAETAEYYQEILDWIEDQEAEEATNKAEAESDRRFFQTGKAF